MSEVSYRTADELETEFGGRVRALRLAHNLDRLTAAERAGVSESAFKNLEAGRGNLRTLVRVVRAMGREAWLLGVSPPTPINPLNMTRAATPRRRASRRK